MGLKWGVPKAVAAAIGVVVILLTWTAAAASAQREVARPDTGKLTPVLATLAQPEVAGASAADQAAEVSLPRRGAGSLLREGDRVLVDVRFDSGAVRARDELKAAGGDVIAVSARYQTDTVAI